MAMFDKSKSNKKEFIANLKSLQTEFWEKNYIEVLQMYYDLFKESENEIKEMALDTFRASLI